MTSSGHDENERAAIEEVRHRYGRALDERDWTLFESLFTDEVDADFSSFGVPAGGVPRAVVVDLMKHSFRRPETRSHQVYANFEIIVNGDAAGSLYSLVGRHLQPGLEGGEGFSLHARHHDRLVRTSDGWKIAASRLEVLFMEGNAAMVA